LLRILQYFQMPASGLEPYVEYVQPDIHDRAMIGVLLYRCLRRMTFMLMLLPINKELNRC